MFTGIVEAVGRIAALHQDAGGAKLRVEAPFASELAIGESVAVGGCCLTVVARSGSSFTADLSRETIARTAFALWGEGAAVNLERALRLQDRLGGHIVQGHVDAVGRLTALEPDGDGHRLVVEVPAELRRYVAHKGSLGVNGISLTVASMHGAQAAFAIIPHTLRATDLQSKRAGDAVHLEVDIIARYVESLTAKEA